VPSEYGSIIDFEKVLFYPRPFHATRTGMVNERGAETVLFPRIMEFLPNAPKFRSFSVWKRATVANTNSKASLCWNFSSLLGLSQPAYLPGKFSRGEIRKPVFRAPETKLLINMGLPGVAISLAANLGSANEPSRLGGLRRFRPRGSDLQGPATSTTTNRFGVELSQDRNIALRLHDIFFSFRCCAIAFFPWGKKSVGARVG